MDWSSEVSWPVFTVKSWENTTCQIFQPPGSLMKSAQIFWQFQLQSAVPSASG